MDTGLRRYLSVSSLSLHHFRNYTSARIEVNAAPVVLFGENGAGKTNILEALSLLSPGRGLRRARLSEIDNSRNAQPWTLSAHIEGMQGTAQIGTARAEEEGADKRVVRIDGKPVPHARLSGHLAMLWLTPQMEHLFYEGASSGRKFLDRLAYGFDAAHATRVSEYEFAMRERNKLLETGGDARWLNTLEKTMAETAASIASARLRTVADINTTMEASPLSFPKAKLTARGLAEDRLAVGESLAQVEEAIRITLEKGRAADAAAGRALAGAHRSELKVFHREKNAAAEACSTGEQKAILLSIVLAQARFSAMEKGVVPVLLLDEVSAHLDMIKRFELFEEICQIGAQAWMTGTDEKLFADLKGKATFFQITGGHISSP